MKLLNRSMASSDAYFAQLKEPVWTKWTIGKMVKDGMQVNTWVYRAITLISQNSSSVPWVVVNKDGEFLWDHRLTTLLNRPNKNFTRQKLMELLVIWIQLSGVGYFKKVKVGGVTKELWAVSPDRIAPIPSADPEIFIEGYMTIKNGGKKERDPDYNAENVIQFKLTDPSNPWTGLSPLGAAARAVDLDNSQQDWNVATMQNRGVVDGVFSFKRQLENSQAQSVMERIKEKFSGIMNARQPLVIGDEATYTRLSLSPAELDFLNSRKANREEIFSVYGVPPQLGGSQEATTYNNYAASMRIFWETTVIPLLDNIKDTLNHSFFDELEEGSYISYDLSGVNAIRDTDDEKAAVVEKYHDMGVPMSQLNEKYELGFEEYEGWDKSSPKQKGSTQPAQAPEVKARFALIPTELRSAEDEMKKRDDLAEGELTKNFTSLLEQTREAVFSALDSGANAAEAVKSLRTEWRDGIAAAYKVVMEEFIPTVSARKDGGKLEARTDPLVQAAIDQALEQESVILKELSMIEASTVQKIINQLTYAIEAGLSIDAIKQAIMDTGVFSPQRALTIARTIAGAAASMGQMTSAAMSGATHKIWLTSKAHVREWHVAREGEKVELSKRFSVQRGSVGPRYPCDGDVSGEDRINCRCFMTFSRG